MSTLDARNPHALTFGSTLDSRNPQMRQAQQDPRSYTSPNPYQEYPKWIELADGTGIVVENEAEEAHVTAEDPDSEGGDADGGAAAAPTQRRGRLSNAEKAARAAAAAEQASGD
ncbi:hypothetical protein LGM57_10770 [Burkholderia cepacia]|uniref:hypothetical protein n=1 Tax=Burkholderia cepacia TaxID=292 RepID=UPI001CF1A407|nr:hypothetical protein [Burkholderia cepacia]MCA7976802.1 hypothetical protein [Burkholderia cepacia]